MNQKLLVLLLVLFLGVSCQNAETEKKTATTEKTDQSADLPDLSGVYKLPENTCDLTLEIKSENNQFQYYFKGMNGIIDMTGTLIISKDADDYLVTFDGPIENNAPKTVQGLYKDNTITIQNYGNADQNFTIFSDCDVKYLEFKK